MLVSTKGRYILRVMIDLAEHNDSGYIPLKQVALRQNISLKYLEKILPILTKNNYITGISGKGGGYKLKFSASEYKVGDILRLVEGNFVSISCVNNKNNSCEKIKTCRTYNLWNGLNDTINNYLDSFTLQDLMKK